MYCICHCRSILVALLLCTTAVRCSNTTDSYDEDEGLGDDAVTTRSSDIKTMLKSISSIGVPANLMTAVVILETPSMRRKPFNLFILHQSFVDFIACLGTFFLQFFDDIHDVSNTVAADIFCRVWVATSWMWINILASTYNLTFMTLERHQAVTRPLQYDESKVRRRLPYACVAAWLLAAAVFSPDVIFSRIVDDECRANIDIPPNLYKFFFFFWMFMTTIIPSVVMVSCYAHMAYVLRQSSKQFDTDDGRGEKRKQDNRVDHMKTAQNNVLQTGVILVIVYVICWSYLILINAFIVYQVLDNFSSMEWNLALTLVLGNSCINPFIYSFRYREFQIAAKSLFKKIFCKKQSNVQEVSSITKSTV